MSESISKISKLVITESFLQTNFNKGYKYIDRAGQLVNDFYVDDVEPLFKMNTDGLVVRQEKDIFEEVRISPKNIWTHYKSPDSLDSISTNYSGILKTVATTIAAENFTRIGWRTYFVKEFNTIQARDNAIKKFNFSEGLNFKAGYFEGGVNDFSLNLFVKKVTIDSDGADRGVLIDVDLYKSFAEYQNLEEVDGMLKNIFEAYRSERLLQFVNKVISTEE